ncbi:MAG: alpha/beta fold hydrolase [Aeromicrobium sp.]
MSVPVVAFSDAVGSGPLVVLGPSLGTSGAALWRTTIPLLQDRFSLVSWDLPGHGASPAPTDGFSVADLADAVAAGIRERTDARVRYAGVSLGGAVGLQLALRHPDLLDAVAVIASGAKLSTPEAWAERIGLVRSQSTSALVAPSARRWFAEGSPAREPETTGLLLHALQDADDEGYARCCEALAGHDVRAELGRIRTPTLVVWGADDAVAPEEAARTMADGIPGARIARVDEAAHLPPAEQPAATAGLLAPFFADPRGDRP